jgi:CDP-diacylglycerol--serine O-phosphatidyltransferase
MSITKHIPNLFTLGNLLCGTIATIFAVHSQFYGVAIFVLLGIILDFFDGFLARLFKVQGELGKQLDSLADMVTSGVAPGLVMFAMLNDDSPFYASQRDGFMNWTTVKIEWIQLFGLLLVLAACYRLAKFNIDTRQTDSFIGLPTPAMSLFVISLPIIYEETSLEFVRSLLENKYTLIGMSVLLSILMNANLPLLSLKFKTYGFKENLMKYLLILISMVMIVTLKYLAVPLIIVVYILLSMIENLSKPKQIV